MNPMRILSVLSVAAICLSVSSITNVNAQEVSAPVQCGQIIDGEFLRGGGEGRQLYTVPLNPGDKLSASGDTVGDYLAIHIAISAPTTGWVAESTSGGAVRQEPVAETNTLSERGNYTIYVTSNGPGLYTLYVGCTLRDGTVIAPGDVAAPQPDTSSPFHDNPVSFSGVGFPGLAPVDFGNVVKLPLLVDTPMTGIVTPAGGEVIGFTLDANADDKIELAFRRLSGNLNLGVTVLSDDNSVVFYGGLVTSESLSTVFTVPAAGQYTIGVFRVDLLPPSSPEATAFQVQATLSS